MQCGVVPVTQWWALQAFPNSKFFVLGFPALSLISLLPSPGAGVGGVEQAGPTESLRNEGRKGGLFLCL